MHMTLEAKEIPLRLITPNADQPRRVFTEESIEELAQSLQESGLITPITVGKTATGYEIVAGERRYRAATLLGWETIEAKIGDYDDENDAYIASFVENEQRDNLSPIETARALKKIMEEGNLTQGGVARRIGRSRSWVAQKLRLLKLPNETQTLVERGDLAEGHGRQLLKLATVGQTNEMGPLAKRASAEGWSVSRLQSEVDVAIAGDADPDLSTMDWTMEDAIEAAFWLGAATALGCVT
jgi:ParB family chromosome partitioning protein